MFIDQHLSETVEQLRAGQIAPVDIAVVEATAITENGGIVPTTSVGNSASFAVLAKKIIVEINLTMPLGLEGLHDIYIPTYRPHRLPIPLISPEQRIGLPFIPVDPEKIVAIVVTQKADSPSNVLPPDAETRAIAGHLNDFLAHEVKAGRLSPALQPLQAGIGTIANAVLHGMLDSPFRDLKMYSEVLQDSTIELLDAGRLSFASASSITLSKDTYERVLGDIERYKSRLVLRPQEISNHPEVIRRLGLITINTALECDIYGNVNSTHVGGTHMMNGIGGSGDFARNAHLSVFVTKAAAKHGAISSIVPMVSRGPHRARHRHLRHRARPGRPARPGPAGAGAADHRQLRRPALPRPAAGLLRPRLPPRRPHAAPAAGGLAWHLRFERTGSMLEQQRQPEAVPA
jgi:succinyl-CoA:acetate CoA-transferase